MNLRLLLTAWAFALAMPAHAAALRAPHIEAELVAERTGWLAGSTNWVALRLVPDEGWHTYWRNPGDSGKPTALAWTLPSGWSAGDIQWPYPQSFRLGSLVNYGYGGETLHLVPIEVPARLPEPQYTVRATAKWLVCEQICIPGEATLALTLPASPIATADPAWSPRFHDARTKLPAAEALSGTFAIGEGDLRLRVQAPALSGAQRVEFFPYAGDLVNHGAPQRVALAGDAVRIAQAQSPYATGAPARVEGVLVVHGAATQAYPVAATPGEVATVPPPPAALPAPAPPALALVLAFALLGGLILNLMPCVFPVLSIKAVSVLESRRGDVAAERRHALAYTAGVVLSSIAAAVALVVLRSGGERLGWGFQLQSPVFVALLAYLMLALGLSLSGLVQLGTRLMGAGQSLVEQGGYAGSFFTGVLAVVVASPCTAPFMGTALGYALAQPAPVAVLVFAVLGLGLALPFLLLGFFPRLGAWLPRPGHWMETFKQFMAFPLYLTVAWLLWVLGHQTSVDGTGLAMAGLVLVAFALWLWSERARGRGRALLALASLAGAVALTAHPLIRAPARAAAPVPPAAAAGDSARGEPYSEARLAELRAQQRPVFVNFTADWCISCKVNERAVFSRDDVRRALADAGVVWMTADWTNPDPVISAALARFGRGGVPLYVFYPRSGEPVVLPQILTPEAFLEAVRRASAG